MQGSNPHLLHWQAGSLPSEPPGVSVHLLLLVHAFKRIFASCPSVCPAATASLCLQCGHSRASTSWNANTTHIASNSSLGLLSRILKGKTIREELASFSSAFAIQLFCLDSGKPPHPPGVPQTEGEKRRPFKFKWENYEISGFAKN